MPENPVLFDRTSTAIVITDPQNDFLAETGKLNGLVAESISRLGTVNNIETLMRVAKSERITLAVDPLVYDAQDGDWLNPGILQKQLLDMHALRMPDNGLIEGSGADFYEPFKTYIYDQETIIARPHKMYGPESNDLIYQLRARGVDTVILGGLVANLCVDSHMRSFMENGFRVYVVSDAVAAPGDDAFQAAIVNFNMIANGVFSTVEILNAITQLSPVQTAL